jgi:hypothetical protein
MDDRFEDQLREAARDYHLPPETPREEMWARIVAARADRAEAAERAEIAERTGGSARSFRNFGIFRFAAGIAALLAIGVGLGRLTVNAPESPAPAVPVASEESSINALAYRLATTEHLSQAEAFLTLFRVSVRDRATYQIASATARQLLASNRLLLDSPAASDARIRLLLQDLELVLAEIAQLSPRTRAQDLELITEGLEETGVLSQLRTAVPAGTIVTQGAL